MTVGPTTETKRQWLEPDPGAPSEPATRKARRLAKETCATLPDLNTVEGQDAFFHMVGVEGIEQCFREDLKNVAEVYRRKVDEHAGTERASDLGSPPVLIDRSYFRDTKTASVPGDGDCAFHSLIESARNQAVSALPPTPTEMREQMVAHVKREYATWRGMPVNEIPDEKQYLATLPSDDRERGRMLEQLATPGSWHHTMGDLYVAIAADTFRMQIEVITPYTDGHHKQVFGPPRHTELRLVLRYSGGHYEPVVD